MNEKSEKPSRDGRISRHRHGGGIVPTPSLSSSCEGLSSECTAGSEVLVTTANEPRSLPTIISMVEFPPGPSGINNFCQIKDRREKEPFVKPAAVGEEGQGQDRPGSLSRKKKKQNQRAGAEIYTDEVNMDSDGSDVSRRSAGSTSTTSSYASGIKRKRGFPPTTGEYTGLKEAKEKACEAELRLMEIQAEREVAELAHEARLTRLRSRQLLPAANQSGLEQIEQLESDNIEDEMNEPNIEGTIALKQRIKNDLDMVTMVASKSSNLKGGYIKILKDAAASLNSITDVLLSRTAKEENIQLEKENRQLKKNNEVLKAEIKNLRMEMSEMKELMTEMRKDIIRGFPSSTNPRMETNKSITDENLNEMEVETINCPPPQIIGKERSPRNLKNGRNNIPKSIATKEDEFVERTTAVIMNQVGTMLNARLEALEGRLLPETSFRPKLKGQTNALMPSKQSR